MRLTTCLLALALASTLVAQNGPPPLPDEAHDFDFWIGSA